MQKQDNHEKHFIIEVCENCRTHNWNTRHDEAKYKQYADESKHFLDIHPVKGGSVIKRGSFLIF